MSWGVTNGTEHMTGHAIHNWNDLFRCRWRVLCSEWNKCERTETHCVRNRCKWNHSIYVQFFFFFKMNWMSGCGAAYCNIATEIIMNCPWMPSLLRHYGDKFETKEVERKRTDYEEFFFSSVVVLSLVLFGGFQWMSKTKAKKKKIFVNYTALLRFELRSQCAQRSHSVWSTEHGRPSMCDQLIAKLKKKSEKYLLKRAKLQ